MGDLPGSCFPAATAAVATASCRESTRRSRPGAGTAGWLPSSVSHCARKGLAPSAANVARAATSSLAAARRWPARRSARVRPLLEAGECLLERHAQPGEVPGTFGEAGLGGILLAPGGGKLTADPGSRRDADLRRTPPGGLLVGAQRGSGFGQPAGPRQSPGVAGPRSSAWRGSEPGQTAHPGRCRSPTAASTLSGSSRATPRAALMLAISSRSPGEPGRAYPVAAATCA